MGCSSVKILDEKKLDTSNILSTRDNKSDINSLKIHSKRKLKLMDEFQEIINEENELLNQFNSNYENKEGISLSLLSNYYIQANKENTNIISLSSNEKIIKCLRNINPFNEKIDDNLEPLKSNLIKIESKYPKLIKPISPFFHLNLSQVIHQDYNFNFKLKNILTNEYISFNFNTLDKPILFIFFDILSFESINKIKEIKKYEKEMEKNENKNFLLIPIMNIFVNEKDNLNAQKIYLKSIDINFDCFILVQDINSNFIKLFELDCITQSKCIGINRNSEISLILNDQVQFLTIEIVEFYLNTRNSDYTNDYFDKNKYIELENILKKDKFKKNFELFSENFNLEIEFKNIEKKKYPVNIRFMYHQKDIKHAENILIELKDIFKNRINKYFIAENIIQDKKKNILKALDTLKQKLKKLNNKEIKNSSFILLNQISSIYKNNKISKNKKYNLKYYLDDILLFNSTLDLLSSNLYNNPEFTELGCGYSIIPKKGVKLHKNIEGCREVKLFKDKKSQLKYQANNKDINFNLEDNKIEVIILINPNIFLNSNEQKEHIRNIFDILYYNKINFIICVFSYNELDAQKLRYLSWEKIYSEKEVKKNGADLGKKNYFTIIYLNSTSPQNYLYFSLYIEDITFKMLHINSKCEILNFYDLDNFSSRDFINLKKDKNIFEYFDNISKNENYNQKDYETGKKIFSKNKNDIIKYITENKYLQKLRNNICTIMNFSLVYDKYLLFNEQNVFSEYKTEYKNIELNIIYFDYLKSNLNIEKINSIIEKNNNDCPLKIIFHEIELKTINLFPKITKTYICSKCLNEKPFNKESFYMCNFCRDTDYLLCIDCYQKLYSEFKNKTDDDDFFKDFILQDSNNPKDKEEGKEEYIYEKIHEHPLLFLYNFNINKKVHIIKDIYDKYIYYIQNKKKNNKTDIKICSICSNYLFEDTKNISVVISHIKTKYDYSKYSKAYDEIFICDNCFITKEFENILSKEENDNNFCILRLLTN